MKKLLVIALGLGLMVGVASLTSAADKGGGVDRAAKKAEMLKKYDKNNDGKLDADERKAMQDDQNLKKYDKNGNGKLDDDEKAQMEKDLKAKQDKQGKKKQQ